MTPTELKLTAIHKGPVARLADISKQYLGMEPAEAAKLAALNRLPFHTFKLRESRKAPLMVRVVDLAAHIDSTSKCAKESWDNSKV